MTDGVFREIAVKVRRSTRKQLKNATRGVLDDAGRLILAGGQKAGQLGPPDGGTGHDQGAEPPLGNPPGAGYVLSSTADGARRWVPLIAGAGITITIDPSTGAITISNTLALDTLTFGGDDLTFGGERLGFGEA